MVSLTWWTWVWASSRSWCWTGKPGVLQSMRSQRVGHDWATEWNWTGLKKTRYTKFKNLVLFYIWEGTRVRAPDVFSFICMSAILGPVSCVFFHIMSSSVLTIRSGCSLGASRLHRYASPSWAPWRAGIPGNCDILLTPVFLPGKSHGQRSQADYSPWVPKWVRHNLATKQQQQ